MRPASIRWKIGSLLAVALDALPLNLAAGLVQSVASDNQGYLWATGGSYGESVLQFASDGSNATSPTVPQNFRATGLLAPGPDGSMYAGGELPDIGPMLIRFQNGQSTTFPLPPYPQAVAFDTTGHVWVTSVLLQQVGTSESSEPFRQGSTSPRDTATISRRRVPTTGRPASPRWLVAASRGSTDRAGFVTARTAPSRRLR